MRGSLIIRHGRNVSIERENHHINKQNFKECIRLCHVLFQSKLRSFLLVEQSGRGKKNLFFLFICCLFAEALCAQNQRYLSYPLLNEDRNEHLDFIQDAHDNGCNAVAFTIQWGSIYGFHSTQYPAGTGWNQYDHQIAKARALGMKIGIRINAQTACPKQYDPGMFQNTCDGWLASERMFGAKADGSDPLYVHQENGGPSNADPTVYVDGVMTSLAAQSTLQRIQDFTTEVINRYKYLANTNELLYVNLVYNRTSEAGFDTETTKNDGPPVLYDYSEPMVNGFRNWLQQRYCTIGQLNTTWGTSYTHYDQIGPKRPTGTFQSAFQGKDGRDWFRYRTEVLKNVSNMFAGTVRGIDNRIKVITDYGSVFDVLSVRRGSFDFPTIDGNMDGIKLNDGWNYDHRFAMDLIRSNMPGKMVMNEVGYDGDANEAMQQLEQCFNHGAKLVSVFQLHNFLAQGHGPMLQQFAASYINGVNVPVINPSKTATFNLTSMIDNGGCLTDGSSPSMECDAYKNWLVAYNQSNSPVKLLMNNDLAGTISCIGVDFGDAPGTYNVSRTTGAARHAIEKNVNGEVTLKLGTLVDEEADGIASNGTSDNTTGSNDEDGVASFPGAPAATNRTTANYTVTVAVKNNTGKIANLCGWIDWDRSGTFDTGESACATVANGVTSAQLVWASTANISTYGRFRITTDVLSNPNGDASNGEVEDYFITFNPLPVTLVSFTAEKSEKTSVLSWSTTEETNSDRFEIEHSLNGMNWTKIGEVKSNGDSNVLKNYSFTDRTPVGGENFYRLRMVDLDETFAYSRIRGVSFEGEGETIVYPNPVSDYLLMNMDDVSTVKNVTLVNNAGVSVLITSDVTNRGIDVKALSAGLYLVEIVRKDGTKSTHKVVIAR